jgi:glycosyltransferase involved in cell wall biosynthesis
MGLDALVLIQLTERPARLRQMLSSSTRLILWTQHAADQPQVEILRDPQVRGAFDGIVLVSDWQRQEFSRHFTIDLARAAVLRNAVAPCFESLFAPDESILQAKTQPPVLVYTSTPFRGLRLLPEIFPRIHARVPGVRLEIYSSMKVYNAADAEDQQQYGALYQRLRQMEGVEYIGSLPQPALAQRLRSASILAYPNIFAETSCISVMEAMAAGCRIVTTQLGALPETAAGFAELISTAQSEQSYIEQFSDRAVSVLLQMTTPSNDAASVHLRNQVDHIRQTCTWTLRSTQWTDWLASLE